MAPRPRIVLLWKKTKRCWEIVIHDVKGPGIGSGPLCTEGVGAVACAGTLGDVVLFAVPVAVFAACAAAPGASIARG
jgi:hypothetical protein